MDFSFSEEQEAVKELAAQILEGTINSELLGLTVANPAAAKVRADVDGDNIEDLLIGNSADSFSAARHLYVFFGGAGLSGLHDRSAAADVYTAPATWTTVTRTLWTGDLDDNGMEDMVWSDAATTTATTGAIQPLY